MRELQIKNYEVPFYIYENVYNQKDNKSVDKKIKNKVLVKMWRTGTHILLGQVLKWYSHFGKVWQFKVKKKF